MALPRRRDAAEPAAAQGVLDVIVNTRMTVVQLRDGSLFVHAPVAPTRECLRLLRELNAPVKYIVLPTSAVEHKARAAPLRWADTTRVDADSTRADVDVLAALL